MLIGCLTLSLFAGVVFGVVVIVLIIAVLLYCCCCQLRR